MASEAQETQETYEVRPIGFVRRRDGRTLLEIRAPHRPALLGLGDFSHAQVLWWFHRFDTKEHRGMTQMDPPFEAPTLGVFALKTPMRPNPIGLSAVKLAAVDPERGVIEVPRIDAYDGTPLLDLKGYVPAFDRVAAPRVPRWASRWPDAMPDEGVELDQVPE